MHLRLIVPATALLALACGGSPETPPTTVLPPPAAADCSVAPPDALVWKDGEARITTCVTLTEGQSVWVGATTRDGDARQVDFDAVEVTGAGGHTIVISGNPPREPLEFQVGVWETKESPCTSLRQGCKDFGYLLDDPIGDPELGWTDVTPPEVTIRNAGGDLAVTRAAVEKWGTWPIAASTGADLLPMPVTEVVYREGLDVVRANWLAESIRNTIPGIRVEVRSDPTLSSRIEVRSGSNANPPMRVEPPGVGGVEVETVQFTEDSRFVLITAKTTIGSMDDTYWEGRVVDVYSVTGGPSMRFRMEPGDGANPPPEVKDWPLKDAFDGWVAGRGALVESSKSATCGSATFEARHTDYQGYGEDALTSRQEDGATIYHPGQGVWTFLWIGPPGRMAVVNAGSDVYDQYRTDDFGGDGTIEVAAFWAPDCAHAVVVKSDPVGSMVGNGPDWYRVVAVGPQIEVLSPGDVDPLPTIAALSAAGWPVASSGEAKSHRDATVIYADGESYELAKKLADAIPGGATVERLSWPTNAQIVVAVGG